MKSIASVLLLLFAPLIASAMPAAEKIVKESFQAEGKERAYYLFVPDAVKTPQRLPLIVLLHGSGRNGLSLVEKWKDLAKREGIILVGPDAANSAQWAMPIDGPNFLHELVELLKTKHPVDPRRVYLFGHSAGAGFALLMSLLEPEYFAATAIHAGALRQDATGSIERATRKFPISIQVGTNDRFFPLSAVRATRDALNAHGFAVELTEIANHTHWYYDRASKINSAAWDFLRKHALTEEPRYEQYRFAAHNEVERTCERQLRC